MTTGWDDNEPQIEPLESSKYTPARLEALGKAFPGERIVIPAGQPKVRNNDCDVRVPSGYDVFLLHRFG